MQTTLIKRSGFSAVIVFLLFCAAHSVYAQEIAVIPYSVETIERDFPVDSGAEYAKTISLAAVIYKNIPVLLFKETQKALSSMGIDPQTTITAEDIDLFCKSRYLSYAVLGRISKTSGGFSSHSVLYSTARKGIIAKADVKARTLPELAAKESEELFSRFNDTSDSPPAKESDIAVVLDSSYTMKQEWGQISASMTNLVSRLIDNKPGTRIHLFPFAETFSQKSLLSPIETVPAAKSALSAITLKGGGTGKAFAAALNSAIENTPWRSSRIILVISNSPIADSSFDRYAFRAKQRNITIHTLTLGNTSDRDSNLLGRLASMTNGSHYSVSYRQKAYTSKGEDYFLYMQDERLFQGESPAESWVDGILIRHKKGTSYVETPAFADELTVKSSLKVTPYTMADYYKKSGPQSMLNADALESNISRCIEQLSESWYSGIDDKTPVARVLLSSGRNSLWISVLKQSDLEFFQKQKELGFVFPLGVRILLKNSEPFGMTFNPLSYYCGFDGESLPAGVRTSLADIIKNPGRFAKNGMFNPPVWFVNVKIEEIESKQRRSDLRDTLK